MSKILILGGTKDARELAELCVNTLGPNREIITSLAGRTRSPQTIAGSVRIGGFGSTDGLINYIRDENISALVDATHPFADTISSHAARAAQSTGIPRTMIERPAWALPAGLDVTRVPCLEDTVPVLRKLACRHVFVTTGIRGLDVFSGLSEIHFLIRRIEDHEGPPPFANAEIAVQKPPFVLNEERNTMTAHNIDALVTRESGGAATEAKILAAAELAIPVVMIERPAPPPGETASSPGEALNWITGLALNEPEGAAHDGGLRHTVGCHQRMTGPVHDPP